MIETLHLMHKNIPLTDITVDWSTDKVLKVKNWSNLTNLIPFPDESLHSWEEFQYFIQYRCFDKSNGQSKRILRSLGLNLFDPRLIIHITHGRNMDDYNWLWVDGEEGLTYEDILQEERDSYIHR